MATAPSSRICERGLPRAGATPGASAFRDIEQLRGFLWQRRPLGAVRPAVDAALCRACCSALHSWLGLIGAGRHRRPFRAHLPHRPVQRRASARGDRQRPTRPRPAPKRRAAMPRRSCRSAWPAHLLKRWRIVAQDSARRAIGGQRRRRRCSPPCRASRAWRCNRWCWRLGAYLVIEGEVTGGVMIASSILLGRALAPVELAIANWKGFIGARQSYAPAVGPISSSRPPAAMVALPAPSAAPRRREAERDGADGSPKPILRDVSFCAVGRRRARRDRAERRRQIDPGPRADRHLGDRSAASSAWTAPPSINGRAPRPGVTSAICRSRSNCWPARVAREHRPLRSRRDLGRDPARGADGRCRRSGPRLPQGFDTAGGRERPAPFRRPAPAHRAWPAPCSATRSWW